MIQPLNDRVPIINDDGTPTQYFIRILQERGITVNEKITLEELIAVLADIDINVIAPLTGGGPINSDISIGHGPSGVTPGSYTNADITVDADGHVTSAANGSGGGGGNWWFDPPLASSFSLTTAGGSNATLTDDPDVGLMIDPVNLDGTFKFMYRTLTDKTLNWSCVARLTTFMFNQNYASYGIYMQDSVGGRGMSNAMTNNVGMAATKFNSLSSYHSDYIRSGISPGPPDAIWFRVDRTGGNLIWMVSGDGKNWATFNTQSVTNFLSNPPDRVGIYVASNAFGLRASCANFSLTGPAV